MRIASAIVLVLLLVSCDGVVSDVQVRAPSGPKIAITNPDYVVLRPVGSLPRPGSASSQLNGQTLYFDPTARILDLRHLDPATARIDAGPVGTNVVAIRTTPEGDQLLGSWTTAHLDEQLGVFLNGQLLSAPHIKSKITDLIVIEGDFTEDQAKAVVARLKRGG